MTFDPDDFGRRYAEAWCGRDPDRVAAFFSPAGSLAVNGEPPAIGRAAIAEVARGFMRDFPDLRVTMDRMARSARGWEFQWTLEGTNAGPAGTGRRVRIEGHEDWRIGDDGLVAESQGHFDAGEYARQLEHGVPEVTLRRITEATARAIMALAVAPAQQRFVAGNAVSLGQALFSDEAWYRAIYWKDEPAGFLMLADETLRPAPPPKPAVALWRFMVDVRFQGKGIGRAALLQVIDRLRARGVFDRLVTSYVPGEGCPEPFYRALGFVPNGQMDGDEVVLVLPLAEPRP